MCVYNVSTHLFEQSENVNREEAHGGGDDEAGLLQVGHIALVGADQIHHRVDQSVTGVGQAGRYRPVDGWSTGWETLGGEV